MYLFTVWRRKTFPKHATVKQFCWLWFHSTYLPNREILCIKNDNKSNQTISNQILQEYIIHKYLTKMHMQIYKARFFLLVWFTDFFFSFRVRGRKKNSGHFQNFFSCFLFPEKTVGGFVNQLIKKLSPNMILRGKCFGLQYINIAYNIFSYI